MQSAKETSRHGASNGYHGSSSAPQSNPPTIPPSPTSLEVQNDIVINEETTSRGSVLSTRKATINKSIQPVEKAAEMKRPFVCRGTCPELTCEHRTDLRINTNKPPHNNRLQFQQLTGFSPSLKKGFSSTSSSQNTTIQAKVEESSDDNGLRPPFLKKPLNVRIASMKMQIDALQSRSPSVRGIKIESSSTPPREIRSSSKGSDMSRKLSHGVSNKVEIEARSPYAITSNDNFANNKDNIDILDQTLKQAYRKKYCAPESIVLEDCNSMISKSSQTGFNYELVEPLQKDLAETAFAFQSTPVSLK